MKRTYSVLAVLLLAVTLAAPQVRAADAEQVASLASGSDLGLYFDQAELTVVESATRAPKPITQVAENITVITAADLERWNAHDLNEVLSRVTGIFVSTWGRDLANFSYLGIQGSEYEQVQVFVDGMRWNYIDSYLNPTNQIPVEIIERVEIIKGPASSAWGSAFGGMVNIITKGTGKSEQPTGTITGSFGERRTRAGSTQVAGQAGPLGYYLHGGLLDSDGLRSDRWYDGEDLFAKVSATLPAQTTLTLTLGHADADYQYISSDDWPTNYQTDDANRFATATLARPLGQQLHLILFGSLHDRQITDSADDHTTHVVTNDQISEQSSHSGALRIYGDVANHSLSAGAETYRNTYDRADRLWLVQDNTVHEETWAVYLNDTIHWGRAAITPGLRYDAMSIADSQLSPSLGVTFRVNDANLLRAAVARGFRKPMPFYKFGSPVYFFTANPQFESEVVDSYQAGLENVAIPFLRLKATLFQHNAKDTWVWAQDSNLNWIRDNSGGGVTRNGVELELETERFAGLSVQANHTYVQFHFDTDREQGDTSVSNLVLDYEGPWRLSGRLAGNYVWTSYGTYEQHQDMTWDATATKGIELNGRCRLDIFTSVRNLFNGGQYDQLMQTNSNRWLEAGLRLHF